MLPLLHEAWISIGTSRLRTFLAMLGIVIGVGSVVLLLAIGTGSRHAIEASIESLGSNLLVVMPGTTNNQGLRSADISHLTMQDVDAIANLPTIQAAAPSTGGRAFQAAVGKLNWSTQAVGTTPPYFSVRNWTFADGQSFSDEDVKLGANVAVIGEMLAEKLFPDETASGASILGRSVHLNGMPFRIVGLLAPKGAGFDGRNQDDVIFVPISTAQNRLWGHFYVAGVVQVIYAQAASKEAMDVAQDEISTLMRERHHRRESQPDNFLIRNLASITQVAGDTSQALSLLLGAIASISLVVGGIGIMNIMLVTVTERTREIGIRKAIGATEQQILMQFLLEAVMIACVGSLIGLAAGFGIGLGAEHWLQLTAEFSLWSVLLALGVAAAIGVASGLYPAWKAARLDPVEALRMVAG